MRAFANPDGLATSAARIKAQVTFAARPAAEREELELVAAAYPDGVFASDYAWGLYCDVRPFRPRADLLVPDCDRYEELAEESSYWRDPRDDSDLRVGVCGTESVAYERLDPPVDLGAIRIEAPRDCLAIIFSTPTIGLVDPSWAVAVTHMMREWTLTAYDTVDALVAWSNLFPTVDPFTGLDRPQKLVDMLGRGLAAGDAYDPDGKHYDFLSWVPQAELGVPWRDALGFFAENVAAFDDALNDARRRMKVGERAQEPARRLRLVTVEDLDD